MQLRKGIIFMQIGNKLKNLREAHKYTQDELAQKLHISRQAISKWETGRALPDIENIRQLSLLYHIKIDELLDNNITVKTNTESVGIKQQINKYLILFLAVFSSFVPVIGMVMPIFCWYLLRKRGQNHIILTVILGICVLVGAMNTIILIAPFVIHLGAGMKTEVL